MFRSKRHKCLPVACLTNKRSFPFSVRCVVSFLQYSECRLVCVWVRERVWTCELLFQCIWIGIAEQLCCYSMWEYLPICYRTLFEMMFSVAQTCIISKTRRRMIMMMSNNTIIGISFSARVWALDTVFKTLLTKRAKKKKKYFFLGLFPAEERFLNWFEWIDFFVGRRFVSFWGDKTVNIV